MLVSVVAVFIVCQVCLTSGRVMRSVVSLRPSVSTLDLKTILTVTLIFCKRNCVWIMIIADRGLKVEVSQKPTVRVSKSCNAVGLTSILDRSLLSS